MTGKALEVMLTKKVEQQGMSTLQQRNSKERQTVTRRLSLILPTLQLAFPVIMFPNSHPEF